MHPSELKEIAQPNGERGSLIVIKERGKIKMKEVLKDYGTLWKVELEPIKVKLFTVLVHMIWKLFP